MQLNLKKSILILFLILLLGGFLRLYKLGQQSFVADEYLGINASYGYFKTGEWKFWDFNKEEITDGEYTRAEIYYWQVAQVFRFLPANEFDARLISVMWGIIGIVSIFIISYLVTKNYWIALLAALLMSVSISSLMYDRKLRMYSMFVPVYLWLSYSVFYFLESKAKRGMKLVKDLSEKTKLNWNFLLPAAILAVVSFLTHTLTVNIIPAALAYLLLMAIIKFKKDKTFDKKYILVSLAIILVGILSLSVDRIHAGLVFFSWGVNNWSYLGKVALDYSYAPLAGVFFIGGCYYLIKKHSKIGLWTVVSYLAVLFLAIMVWKRSAGHQYILLTQSFKIIIMASGIYFISATLAEKIFSGSKKWFLGLTLLFLAILINFSFFSSKESFYGNLTKWDYSNYREVFEYYLKHKTNDSVLITRPATNFYLWGTHTNLIGYNENGQELTLEKVVGATNNFSDVWAIFSNTMYIKGDARKFIRDNFQQVETKYNKEEQLEIWHWQRENTNSSK